MSSQSSNDAWRTKATTPNVLPETPPALDKEVGVMAGDRLGSYELLALLGKGGMGMVFRARHVRLKKEFALKVLSPRFARDQDAIRRFERETEAMGRLEHVNLVRASDAGVQSGVPYIVMELLDGANLADLTKQRGAWPIAEACAAVRQAALGLQHAFECGLVHRDVKPSNLWLTSDGVVKVLDLGLARLCDEDNPGSPMTASGMWMGTADYIAPEQILDSHTADIRADLYSLGCTFFHLLNGKPPFADSTHPTLRQKNEAHLKEPPPDIRRRRPDMPAELIGVLMQLLAKRPGDRYQTPAEAAVALTPFASDASLQSMLEGGIIPSASPFASTRSEKQGTIQTGSSSSTVKLKGVLHQHRWLVGAIVGIGLALLLLWWLRSPHGSTPQEQPSSPLLPSTTPKPLERVQIMSLTVKLFESNGKSAGVIGEDVFVAHADDIVKVEARLTRPAYAFLIAFRPDGSPEVCFPEKENERPPMTDKPS